MTIDIAKPIFMGAKGDRKIGIADFRVANEGAITQIRITDTYKKGDRQGKLIYPNLLCMPTSEVVKYPKKEVGKSHKVTVYLIPIRDFRNKQFDLKEPVYYKKIEVPKEPEFKQGVLL